MTLTLAELAEHCQATLRGDPGHRIERVSTLETAGPQDLVFVASRKYLPQLEASRPGAVILREQDAQRYAGNVLISDNPRLCYTRAAERLHPGRQAVPGVHPAALVDSGAQVSASATIGARVVIETGAQVGPRTVIGPGCVIGRNAQIGSDCRLAPNVTIAEDCILGDRCVIQAGAVIGSDGFGYAQDRARWIKTPQLGRVVIAEDVEIGANTTIDRGALGDTRIGRGVKFDILIQVAHNVEIGEDTAIAACVGIAGSTRIGRRCTIAGQVGIVGHIEIADDVHVTGATVVSHTIREPGTYSSGSPLEPYQSWLRNAVRMRQLDDMARRLKIIEKQLLERTEGGKFEKP